MKIERIILYTIILGLLGFNVSNLSKINEIKKMIPQKWGIWNAVYEERDNFIHKLFAKEPLA